MKRLTRTRHRDKKLHVPWREGLFDYVKFFSSFAFFNVIFFFSATLYPLPYIPQLTPRFIDIHMAIHNAMRRLGLLFFPSFQIFLFL